MGQGIFLGGFTPLGGGSAPGISRTRLDPDSGELAPAALASADAGGCPAFLTWHPGGRVLYAAHDAEYGQVSAYAVGEDGTLRLLGSQPSGGAQCCHVTVHPTGRFLLSANYGGGSVAVHPIGERGELLQRTQLLAHAPEEGRRSHAHQVRVTPDGRWVLATDLGLDLVITYRLDLERGRLARECALRLPRGSGPRHVVVHPDGYVFVACELSSQVMGLGYDAGGGRLVHVSTAPATHAAAGDNHPSEIALSDDARHVYVANRGRDCVTVFRVDGAALTALADVPAGGAWPRHIAVAGNRLLVANQHSHNVVGFALDPRSGLPTRSDGIEVASPGCVLVPADESARAAG